ncbi:hypothetical protein H0H93_015737 [Arthromyces matolae]|nr:hypothetical protein H0H93_015737 [Arthromyces matolae]
MPGSEWTSEEQHDYLWDRMDSYRACMATQRYMSFWETLFEDWEKTYPERNVIFPDLDPDVSLTAEQMDVLSKAIDKRRKKARKADKKCAKKMEAIARGKQSRVPQLTHIYSDMYYDEKIGPLVHQELPDGANSGERLAVILRVTRELWSTETSEVVELVRARQAELKREKEAREANPPELLSPEEIAENLENLPGFIGRFLEWLKTQTGWKFSCVMGGPDPSIGGDIRVCSYHVGKTPSGKDFGKCNVEFEKSVMKPYTDFLYTLFPESVRLARVADSSSSEVPAAAQEGPTVDSKGGTAKRQTKSGSGEEKRGKGKGNHVVASTSTTTSPGSSLASNALPGSSNPQKSSATAIPQLNVPHAAPSTTTPSTTTPAQGNGSAAPSQALSPATTSLTSTSAQVGLTAPSHALSPSTTSSSSASSSSTTVDPSAPTYASSQSLTTMVNDPAAPTHASLQSQTPSMTMSAQLPQPPLVATNALSVSNLDTLALVATTSQHASSLPGGFTFSSSFMSDSWADPGSFLSSLHLPGEHTADNYQFQETIPQQYDFGLSFPFDMNHQFSPMSPDLSHPSGAWQPQTLMSLHPTNGFFSSPHLPFVLAESSSVHAGFVAPIAPDVSQLTSSTASTILSAVSSANPSIPVATRVPNPNPAVPTPVPAPHASVDSTSVPTPQGLADPSSEPVAPIVPPSNPSNPTHHDESALKSISTNLSNQSRSGRVIMPSTRNEQSNKIGTDVVPPRGKENIPPIETTPATDEQPPYVKAAFGHFKTSDLGDEWDSCVDAWGSFEKALLYRNSKGLPLPKERPEEWTQWTVKGHRVYANVPVIHNPMEFGLAIVSWWKKMQPTIRQDTQALLPVKISDCVFNTDEDVWASLRRSGQNGMIVVVTLLAWWGQHAQVVKQYQEDSRDLWKECVRDVRDCLAVMTEPPQRRKRPATGAPAEVPQAKRVKKD